MPAPLNNQFWKLRTTHGRDRLFSDPELLWTEACKYFEHTNQRKWIKQDWVGKDGTYVERESETPYTKSGLCVFLDVSEWRILSDLKKVSEDFSRVVSRIEQIIYTQKIEGAAVGAFNANIVARELGLKDSTDHTTDGKPLPSSSPISITVHKTDE